VISENVRQCFIFILFYAFLSLNHFFLVQLGERKETTKGKSIKSREMKKRFSTVTICRITCFVICQKQT